MSCECKNIVDIKIIVATHKKYWMPKDDIYCVVGGRHQCGHLPEIKLGMKIENDRRWSCTILSVLVGGWI